MSPINNPSWILCIHILELDFCLEIPKFFILRKNKFLDSLCTDAWFSGHQIVAVFYFLISFLEIFGIYFPLHWTIFDTHEYIVKTSIFVENVNLSMVKALNISLHIVILVLSIWILWMFLEFILQVFRALRSIFSWNEFNVWSSDVFW